MFVLISHGPNGLGAFGDFSVKQYPKPYNSEEIDNIYNIEEIDNIFNTKANDDIIIFRNPNCTDSTLNDFDKKK